LNPPPPPLVRGGKGGGKVWSDLRSDKREREGGKRKEKRASRTIPLTCL